MRRLPVVKYAESVPMANVGERLSKAKE